MIVTHKNPKISYGMFTFQTDGVQECLPNFIHLKRFGLLDKLREAGNMLSSLVSLRIMNVDVQNVMVLPPV